jgi:glycosyltransferase involved in cell wall biosynthesis
MAAFYRNCDVTVLPSLNSTESFGLVQIESMLNGVPVVASNLPGVRQPVLMTGMGEIAPVGNPTGLAEAILKVLRDPPSYHRPASVIAQVFSPDETARRYENLFTHLLGRGDAQQDGPAAYEQLRKLRS